MPTTPDRPAPAAAAIPEPAGTFVGELHWLTHTGLVRAQQPARLAPRDRNTGGPAAADTSGLAPARVTLVLGDAGCGKSRLAYLLAGADRAVRWGTILPRPGQTVVSDHHPCELLATDRRRAIAHTVDSGLVRDIPRTGRLILVRSAAEHYAHLALDPAVAVFLFRVRDTAHPTDDQLRMLLGLTAQDAPHLLEQARHLADYQCLYRAPSDRLSTYGARALLDVAAPSSALTRR
jgi:hypothetical protein